MERILCAAIWYPEAGGERPNLPINITCGMVVGGHRHHNCIATLATAYPDYRYKPTMVQGFLTNTNRFVQRVEALLIAYNAKQITKRKYKASVQLYSEDLY